MFGDVSEPHTTDSRCFQGRIFCWWRSFKSPNSHFSLWWRFKKHPIILAVAVISRNDRRIWWRFKNPILHGYRINVFGEASQTKTGHRINVCESVKKRVFISNNYVHRCYVVVPVRVVSPIQSLFITLCAYACVCVNMSNALSRLTVLFLTSLNCFLLKTIILIVYNLIVFM